MFDFNFYGVTIPQLVRFLAQIGLAVAGGASLWGMVFAWRAKRLQGEDREGASSIVSILMQVLVGGAVVFFIAWWFQYLLLFAGSASAHEGITVRNIPVDYIRAGLDAGLSFVLGMMLLTATGTVLYKIRRQQFLHSAKEFFGLQLMLVSVLMYVNVLAPLGAEQFFYFFHSWHSVFTVGSVVVVDVLYIATLHQDAMRRVLYRHFPWISNGIWIGLGLDFLSNMSLYDTHDWTLPVFHYTQIVVAVIIINGTLLSGRINEALVALIRDDGSVGDFDARTERIISFSGAVSIISWMTITFSDFFTLTTPWWLYFGAWGGLIVLVYAMRKPADALLQATLHP